MDESDSIMNGLIYQKQVMFKVTNNLATKTQDLDPQTGSEV